MNSKIFKILFIVIFFSGLNSISAQNYKHLACIAYSSKNEQKWETIISSFQKNGAKFSLEQKIDLIGYYYGYISLLLDEKKYDKAQIFVQKGEILLDEYLKKYTRNSTLNSFKGAFIGFHIGLSKFSAIYLASSSNEYVDKALSLDSNNPQAFVDKGNILLHTPWLFGGNKKKSIIYFKKAVSIYEKKKQARDNWLYLSALDDLAKAYTRTEQTEMAKKIIIQR